MDYVFTRLNIQFWRGWRINKNKNFCSEFIKSLRGHPPKFYPNLGGDFPRRCQAPFTNIKSEKDYNQTPIIVLSQ